MAIMLDKPERKTMRIGRGAQGFIRTFEQLSAVGRSRCDFEGDYVTLLATSVSHRANREGVDLWDVPAPH